MLRTSRVIVLAAALIAGFVAQAGARQAAAGYNGYKGDTQAWKGKISRENGKVVETIEGMGGNPDREAVTLTGAAAGELFAETLNGLPGHSVVVKEGFVYVYDGQGMTGMVAVEEPPLVFDPTLPSHYGILLARYDGAKGGTQRIAVIVTEKADYWKVEIAPRPAATIPIGEAQKESKVYQVRVDRDQYATVWTLDDAVAAVYVQWKDEYMVDAAYPMLQQKIQMLVKRSI